MKMGFRWYGKGNDSISLEHIKQIPDTTEIVWALHHKQAGEVWHQEEVDLAMKEITDAGLHGSVVESVNVHEDIKLGLPSRDAYIDNYIVTLKNLAKAGVKVVCYNFMPIFDWARTDLFKEMGDGATALFFEKAQIADVDPFALVEKVLAGSGEYTMPGWEPERLAHLQDLFRSYKGVDEAQLRSNLKYFLERITPTCEEVGIKMAIHPDDPPYSIFGLPRIVRHAQDLRELLALCDSPSHGLTLCTGALGANLDNNLPSIVEEFFERIYFMHVRNVKVWNNGDFMEMAHRTSAGSVDVTGVVEVLHRKKFAYVVRPDHGRHIWGEKSRPGYGLYDRALGIMYIWGLYDAFQRKEEEE
ncbi:mannonate dehydratase [Entomospira entomophila]|uniref:Mannonate dehydratase n=1 Tax=Entomospira entomophila TaxID=2719988 RepID=A0A968KWE1_9SPIO|nr:mannonate dehydratase [Entomospira entomophilus]NIZ40725.1 mannonate dehydratase [Entomospira entomophilus]WDI34938.1 mannonate dehydratase [Entomospira entomophilus]